MAHTCCPSYSGCCGGRIDCLSLAVQDCSEHHCTPIWVTETLFQKEEAAIFQNLDVYNSFLGLCKWLSKYNHRGNSEIGLPSFTTASLSV